MADKVFYEELQSKFEDAGLKISKGGTKALFGICVESMFDTAIKDGSMRLPAGFGALKVRDLQATTKQNPRTGDKVEVPERKVIRYVQGKSVKSNLNV